jgi:hypothetical protein
MKYVILVNLVSFMATSEFVKGSYLLQGSSFNFELNSFQSHGISSPIFPFPSERWIEDTGTTPIKLHVCRMLSVFDLQDPKRKECMERNRLCFPRQHQQVPSIAHCLIGLDAPPLGKDFMFCVSSSWAN